MYFQGFERGRERDHVHGRVGNQCRQNMPLETIQKLIKYTSRDELKIHLGAVVDVGTCIGTDPFGNPIHMRKRSLIHLRGESYLVLFAFSFTSEGPIYNTYHFIPTGVSEFTCMHRSSV